ncbi:ABC transporter substrate-binding protein [Dietzia sp. PP-33]|uniref:ABC transporter substrate-binding protein n=1 Tax=Dietzia sp. PP-33 TaxID=2957500 RepID=UPI0029BCB6CB|nr:ABC transporter substrate-binding protein [Dietzia sp. PP-33]MDX2358084.1 ABC transporter substrate-binding protein [Dietzia sp. PP-33]
MSGRFSVAGFLRSSSVAALAVAVSLVSACSSDTESADAGGETRVVETYYGEVEVPGDPQRIVGVSYDTPMQMMSLGVPLLGAQDYSRNQQEFTADQRDYLSGTEPIGAFGELDFEAVAALEPDLIVGDAYEIDEQAYERLALIAPTAIVFGENRGDWKPVVDALADIVGAEESLAEVSAAYEAKIAEMRDTYADQLDRQTFALVTVGVQEEQFSVQYPNGVPGDLYQDLGVTYAPSIPDEEPETGFAPFPYEQIPEILGQADVIVSPTRPDGTTIEALAPLFEHRLFRTLPSVEAGHAFELTAPSRPLNYVLATRYLDALGAQVLAEIPA